MKEKITCEILLDMGFKFISDIVRAYVLTLTDSTLKTKISNITFYDNKELILSPCNNKGEGEYHIFIKESKIIDDIVEDSVMISLTDNLLYKEDLVSLLKLLKL